MDPRRKRRIRLVVALSAAMMLAGGLIYTSFSAASDARTPSQLLRSAQSGRSYQLTGKVLPGYQVHGNELDFRVRDRNGTASVPVRYTGEIPDPFKTGREVIVTVTPSKGGAFIGKRDSLITKCPSKFSASKGT
jgi:cytochrome c-type biogenesis protein CcmE